MKRGLRLTVQLSLSLRRIWSRFAVWWRSNDREYRIKWKIANAAAVMLFVASIVLPIVQVNWTNKRYLLNADTLSLVGQNNQALASKLSYDAKTATYEFNKGALQPYSPAAAQSELVGGVGKDSKSLYALDVPTDFSKGVTYHDVNSQLDFSLVPQFASLAGRTEQGRIVFPLDGGPQAIYTLKNNGLKEDIVVAGNTQSTLRFSYKLNLPKTLKAKPLADNSGGIGIYGGDPALFSNMSYGSDKDRQLVEKARENADKTNLIFGIPAPVITAKDGKTAGATARFELTGDTLTVVAENLAGLHSTFSLDPSVVVTSTSDFQSGGNNESNIDFNTSGQISRGMPSGGTLGAWSSATATLSAGRIDGSAVAYNGYLYIVGGQASTGDLASVQYALICTGSNSGVQGCSSSAGTLGTWNTASSFSNIREADAVMVYNGYLYVIGGGNLANTQLGDAQYALICTGSNSSVQFGASTSAFDSGSDCDGTSASGSLSAWKGTTSLTTAVAASQYAAYNGYLYVMGGCSSSWINCGGLGIGGVTNSVQRIAIQADGSLASSWDTSQTLPTVRHRGAAVAYNGFMYIIGGCTAGNFANCTSGSSPVNGTLYAPINSDGTLGSWVTGPNLVTASTQDPPEVSVANGYLYALTSTGVGGSNVAQYAPVYANGSLDAFRSTNVYTGSARYQAERVVYNGYAYIVSGCTAISGGNCTAYATDAYSAKVDVVAVTGSYSASSSYNSAGIMSYAAVTTNGYIYLIGGTTDNSGGNASQLNTARYAAINTDGTLGTWSTTSGNFTNLNPTGAGCSPTECKGRLNAAAGVYNGFMYLAGGISNGTGVLWSDIQSAVICTGANAPVSGCVGAGDLRGYNGGSGSATWDTKYKDYIANSTSTYSQADARSKLSMQIYNGYIYLAGGQSGTNAYNAEINFAPLAANGGVGAFAPTINLPSQRAGLKTFVMDGRFYVVGGAAAGASWAYTNNDNDDVLFTTICTGVNTPVSGCSGPGALTSSCPPGYTCTTGSWVDANAVANGGSGSSFVSAGTGLSDYGVAVSGNYIYISGGQTGTGTGNTVSAVYKGKLKSNGSIESWSATVSMPIARNQHGFLAANGYLYTIGGCAATNGLGINCNSTAQMYSDYQYTQVNNGGGGASGAWSTTTNMPYSTGAQESIAYNGYLYVIGGCTAVACVGGGTFNSVYHTNLNTDGTIGTSWTPDTVLTNSRAGFGLVAYSGRIYVIGGYGATGPSNQNDTWFATPSPSNGNITSWTPSTSFSVPRQYTSAVAYNGYMYVLGGSQAGTTGCNTASNNVCSDVQYAPINADGTLGSWHFTHNSTDDSTTFVSGFTTARQNPVTVVNNGYIYIAGGYDTSNNALSDVQYAQLNSNGTVGTWSPAASMTLPRAVAVGAAYNGYFYVYDGMISASSQAPSVEFAPFMSDGSLGRWQQSGTPITTNAATYSYGSGAFANGYIYYLGGQSGLSLGNTVSYSPLQVMSRVGRYSKLIDLGRSTNVRSITSTASTIAPLVQYRAANYSTNVFDTSNSNASGVAPTGTCTGNLSQVRYLELVITIDDTQMAAFGESSGSAVADATIAYYFTHAPPNIRLRTGQTLQSGELTPLDTCGNLAP